MDYEQRHPILQEIYEYLKNTPKEQVDKDWSYVFKETHPAESYYEKKYKEALERARTSFSYPDYPGFMRVDVIFPELRENENDRIVGCLLNYFNHVRYNGLDLKGTDVDEVIAWLEKQKGSYTKKELMDMGFSFTTNGEIVPPKERAED